MSLFNIQDQLLDTQSVLADLEKAVALNPNSKSLQLARASLQKRYSAIESNFKSTAEAMGIEACNYRLFSDERPSAHGVASALATFQNGISVLYDAIVNGPKTKGRYGADVEYATRFNFGYCYSGSVGIVLTIPADRSMFDDSILDESFKAFSMVAKAQDRDTVKELKEKFGLASIRAVYRWVKANSESGQGADIKWERNKQ
jgi:hypothetical protein